ncbi:DUF58 domain-containing protein [Psychrobium sp. nBUS_13]|uniref:DUF58 domain-containing protein n=1 Tax=Psychrobium sp. nBUS_13 TaxID=3395319 RepID=UPI003EBD474A
MKQRLQQRWIHWLKRRMPILQEVTLHRRNIFILPSKFGVVFGLLNVLLFVIGINYQNNLVIMLSSFCFSLFVTTMLFCYQNMAGMLIKPVVRLEYIASQLLSIECQVSCDKGKHGIYFRYKSQPQQLVSLLEQQSSISLTVKEKSRGLHRLPRLIVASEYPLGLFRAWANLEFEQDVIVFPKPIASSQSLSAIEQGDGAYSSKRTVSGDSFSGLEPYREGESLKRVAWKQLAQGKGVLSKQFEQTLGEPQWLDLDDIDGGDIEMKLSHLAYLVNYYSSLNQPFGVKLGNKKIPVGHGNSHRKNALTLLATFGVYHE